MKRFDNWRQRGRKSARDNSMLRSPSRSGSPSRTRLLNTLARVDLLSQGDTYGLGNLFLVMVASQFKSPSKRATEPKRYRATHATEPTEPPRDGAIDATDAIHEAAPATSVKSLLEAAKLALPFGNDIESLFHFARALKAFEQDTGACVADELENALSIWWSVAKPAEADFDDYHGALIRAYERAKVPLGANAIHKAMESAPSIPYNATTAQRIVRLKAVCESLQALSPDAPFFISVRDVAMVMQVESLRKAQNAIALLTYKGFLIVCEKGTPKGRKATRFRLVSERAQRKGIEI